jgi:hypothetical protein
VARSAVGCQCRGDGARTAGREESEPAWLLAHRDALPGASAPSRWQDAAWPGDEPGGEGGREPSAHASDGTPLAALQQAIRASPAGQADETGWREDGRNGSLWRASPPTVRSCDYHHWRGHEGVEALGGPDFQGGEALPSPPPPLSIRGCINEAREHFLRDGQDLKDLSADDAAGQDWFRQVTILSELRRRVRPAALIPAGPRRSSRPLARRIYRPWSRNCGRCVRPVRTRPPPCRPSVTGSNASCLNGSGVSRDQRCPQTPVWRSAGCARWSWRAR